MATFTPVDILIGKKVDNSNTIAYIRAFGGHFVLYEKSEMGGKVCVRNCKSVYWYCFFAWYGTEPIQRYFALPLYLVCGGLFIYESWHNKDDVIMKLNIIQKILLMLYFFYPLVSMLLGNSFPQTVTYIMPCPVISLSIIIYAGYKRKNKILLALLTIWGLTGVKSIIFNAYEDIILLVCGLYGVVLFVNEMKKSKKG